MNGFTKNTLLLVEITSLQMDHSQFWMVGVMRSVTESRASVFVVDQLRFEILWLRDEHVRAAKNDEQIEQLAGCST